MKTVNKDEIKRLRESYLRWAMQTALEKHTDDLSLIAQITNFSETHKYFHERKSKMIKLLLNGKAHTLYGAYVLAGKSLRKSANRL
jgi:hypothetical protein